MVEINVRYLGDLRCEAVHDPSGTRLVTDPPIDNQGRGESFSPTDLAATALGTCMVTLMGIVARRDGIDIEGTTARVKKEMVSTPLRRIGRLTVEIRVPQSLPIESQQKLRNAALTCPVHKSLHPDVEIPAEFHFGPG